MTAGRRYLTTRQAARRLGVAVSTVQKWAEEGRLTGWRTAGGHRRLEPQSVEALAGARAPDATVTAGALCRLYLVEDDPVMLEIYASAVRSWQLPVAIQTFASAFDALIALGREKPDILLLDLRMKGMNGFDLVRQVENSPDFRSLEILVVTALSKEEIEASGGLPDTVSLFHKPLPLDRFRELLEARISTAAIA